jgi:hypothetical protein
MLNGIIHDLLLAWLWNPVLVVEMAAADRVSVRGRVVQCLTGPVITRLRMVDPIRPVTIGSHSSRHSPAAFVSASRPEAMWNGAPRFAWPTKLKSMALRSAGASGGAVACATGRPEQSANQAETVRLDADVHFILKTHLLISL